MMAGPNIDWDYSFPYSDGPGLTGYFEEGWSGEIRVQMTVIVPDDGQDYMFSWWQNFGGGEYQESLTPGQNDLDFVVSDAGYQHDLIRALVLRDGGTSGVSIEIPTEPVVTEIIPLQANDDEAEAVAGEPVNIIVLANDLVNDNPATLEDLVGPPTIVSPPAVGSAVVEADGSITYVAPEGFSGEVELQYKIETPVSGPVCAIFDWDWGILTAMSDTFSTDEPLVATNGDGQTTVLVWDYDYSRWNIDYGMEYFPAAPGDEVTLTQGDVTAFAELKDGVIVSVGSNGIYNLSRSFVGGSGVQLEYNGSTYYGSIGGDDMSLEWWDQLPPSPSTPYIGDLTVFEEGREVFVCAKFMREVG